MSEKKENNVCYEKKTVYEKAGKKTVREAYDYAKEYVKFLDASKTEREAVAESIRIAEAAGYRSYRFGDAMKPGDKFYYNNRGKNLFLFKIGTEPINNGIRITGAHIDSPRIDLKQNPVFEDSGFAFFKTHYYGGIRKYQWLAMPLALHGVVVKQNGEVVNVTVGEKDSDPVMYITDLLPHLAQNEVGKTVSAAFPGERLNILIGSVPYADEGKDRVKLAVLSLLHDDYGITEEDFLSAELTAVPAFQSRDIGFDRSFIGAYGHDDRVCAYAELRAILDLDVPERTAVCILADKEEIGSEGVSGMQSQAFDTFMADLCETQGVALRRCFEKSFCLSADVCNAFDPNYPEVSEKRNEAKVNYGMGICKFTGARGKSGTSDASAEIVAHLRRLFADAGVVWQMCELGKVDQGGGGTIAKYMANRNIDTIDAGVPVLSMHAPFETVSKFDCWMTYKGVLAAYQEKA